MSPLPQAAEQINVVDTFGYLGIHIHPNRDLHVKPNINPLIHTYQEKTVSWIKLPLSVVGRCNLIKMIWSPQLLYALQNASIWIPIHVFKKYNTIFLLLEIEETGVSYQTGNTTGSEGLGCTGSSKPIILFLSGSIAAFNGLAALRVL